MLKGYLAIVNCLMRNDFVVLTYCDEVQTGSREGPRTYLRPTVRVPTKIDPTVTSL